VLLRRLNKTFFLAFPADEFSYFPADNALLTVSTFMFIYVISSPVSNLFDLLPIMFYFSSPLSGLFGLTLRMFDRL
jgi:hypothetical protein